MKLKIVVQTQSGDVFINEVEGRSILIEGVWCFWREDDYGEIIITHFESGYVIPHNGKFCDKLQDAIILTEKKLKTGLLPELLKPIKRRLKKAGIEYPVNDLSLLNVP